MKDRIFNFDNLGVKSSKAIHRIEHYLAGEKFQTIPIKNDDEIAKMKFSGQICAAILDEISPFIKPGITRKKLDATIRELISDKYEAEVNRLSTDAETNASQRISACFGHNNIIVNAEPDEVELMDGDIFGIDISLVKQGWNGDTRKTWLVGEEASPLTMKLFSVSNYAMWLGISLIKDGVSVETVANAVERYANNNGCKMLKLPITCGHSLGKRHMDGWMIPLYSNPINKNRILKKGMVITIETFMTLGNGEAILLDNEMGTAITKDGSYACYWEHAVAVTENGCEILDLRSKEKADWIKYNYA